MKCTVADLLRCMHDAARTVTTCSVALHTIHLVAIWCRPINADIEAVVALSFACSSGVYDRHVLQLKAQR